MKKAKPASVKSFLGLRFTESLKKFPCYYFDFYMTLFNQFEQHGTLPFPGSLADQPNLILEIFNVLRRLNNEEQAKQAKAQQKQSNKRK